MQTDEFDDEQDVTYLADGRAWIGCWQCGGEGTNGHDCGEDCCACLDPEENVRCDICNGRGGWYRKESV